jgi:hypothetical protein
VPAQEHVEGALGMGWRMRTADGMAALHREAAADAAVPAAGDDAPQRTAREQQAFSTHPPARGDEPGEWNTAWDGTDFGANKGGICVAAGPDPMHVLMEGLAEDIRKWTVARARGQTPRTDGELDDRFARMAVQPEWRCSAGCMLSVAEQVYCTPKTSRDTKYIARDMLMQSVKFCSGISDLHSLAAREFVPLMLQLPVALGVEAAILPPRMQASVHTVIARFLDVVRRVRQPEHTRSTLLELEESTDKLRAAILQAFKGILNKNSNEVAFDHPKFHTVFHFAYFIEYWGTLSVLDTGQDMAQGHMFICLILRAICIRQGVGSTTNSW